MRRICSSVLVLLGLVCFQATNAAPRQITEEQFDRAFSNENVRIEGFQEYSEGAHDSPFRLVNGTYVGAGSVDLVPWCDLASVNKCLDTQIMDGRFEQLPAGTTTWSTRLQVSGPQTIQATVVGRSGTLQTEFTTDGGTVGKGSYAGFYDDAGLDSISFHIVDQSSEGFNYAFDDVTTAVSTPEGAAATPAQAAPTLSASVLLMLAVLVGCLGAAAMRRRKNLG